MNKRPDVAVVIASAGRPQLLQEVLKSLELQTYAPMQVVVSVPSDDSLPDAASRTVRVVQCDRGLAAQRNAGIEAAGSASIVVMFDDDSVPREDFVERAVAFFESHPDVCGLTGRVLLDGAVGDAIARQVAVERLAASETLRPSGAWSSSRELYGCNMAIHLARANGERFDERLPLYSWLEDHDMARRLMRHGRLARVEDCVIVHLGVKSGGRTAHRRLGYSQVMNPLYLWRRRSFPLWLAVHETVPRCGKNLVLAVIGSERSWRRRRLSGNLLACWDVVRGRFTPERASSIRADA